MQKPFFNKKLVITMVSLIITFLLIAFSIFVRNDRSTPSFIQNIGNSAAGIVDKVVNAPVEGISRVTGSVSNLTDTYQENAQLKKKLDSMNALQVENETLKQENKQLKQQLSLNKSLTSYDDISAYVISRSPSTWQNQIVISKGSNAGITKGSAASSWVVTNSTLLLFLLTSITRPINPLSETTAEPLVIPAFDPLLITIWFCQVEGEREIT